jgi:hypothetical protein
MIKELKEYLLTSFSSHLITRLTQELELEKRELRQFITILKLVSMLDQREDS